MAALRWKDLGISLGFNCGIAIALFFVFNYIRSSKLLVKFYGPKRYLKLPFRYRPKRLPNTIFTWMVPLFNYTDEEIMACAGLDALTYIRFMNLGLRLSFIVMLISFVIILPTNMSGSFIERQLKLQLQAGITVEGTTSVNSNQAIDAQANGGEAPADEAPIYTDFDKTSLANVDDKSGLLWVHLLATYLVAFAVMRELWNAYRQAVDWRILYLSQARPGGESHSVLVRDIPGCLNGTLLGRIYDNIDGNLGKFLPGFLKARVKKLVETGERVTVTGAGTVTRVGSALGRKFGATLPSAHLFDDEQYDVYLAGFPEGGVKEKAPGSGTYDNFMDAASFASARSSLGQNSLKGSLNLSKTSAGPVAGSVPVTMADEDARPSKQEPLLPVKVPRESFKDPPETLSVHPPDILPPVSPRPTVQQRTNLRFFKSRRAATDFDAWGQAKAAIDSGVSVEELVRREYVRSLPHPEDIVSVTSVKNLKDLAPLMARYDKALLALHDKCDEWTSLLRRRKPVNRKMKSIQPLLLGVRAVDRYGSAPLKVNEMDFLQWRLTDLYEQVKDAQQASLSMEACAAFVTFRSRVTASSVATGMQSHNESFWKTSAAPGPEDIIWDRLTYRGWERSIRLALAWAMLAAGIAFFVFPVVFVQGLINIEKYRGDDPTGIVKFLVTTPFIKDIIKAIIPGLALKIFLLIVPLLIRQLNNLQGIYSHSGIDFEVGRKYFIFQFFVVFVFSVIAGTVLSAFKTYLDHPGQAISDLGAAVPKQAGFYLLYILTNGVLAKAISFLRIFNAVKYVILARLSATERAKRRKWALQYMRYGNDVPDHSIIILLMLVFSCIQPFIVLVSLLSFFANTLFAKYQLLYVFRERFQSGGLFWPVIFDQIYTGLVVFELSMLGILGIKKFPYVVLLLPLLILTAAFRFIAGSTFARPVRNLSLHAAADLDRADRVKHWTKDLTSEEEAAMLETFDCEDVRLGPASERYMGPAFAAITPDYHAALQEAEHLAERMEAGEHADHVSQGDSHEDEDSQALSHVV